VSFTPPQTTAEADPPAPIVTPSAPMPPADKVAAIAIRGHALRATVAASAAPAVQANLALGRLDVAAAAGVDDAIHASAGVEVASAAPVQSLGGAVGAVVTPVSDVTTSVAAPVSATVSAATTTVGNVVGRVGGLLH